MDVTEPRVPFLFIFVLTLTYTKKKKKKLKKKKPNNKKECFDVGKRDAQWSLVVGGWAQGSVSHTGPGPQILRGAELVSPSSRAEWGV